MIPRPPSHLLPTPDGVHWLRGEACHLYVETVGEGAPPLVLIPGLGADLSGFFRQVEGFKGGRGLILIDNRGAGRSQKPDAPFTLDAMAEDVIRVLDALGYPRADVLGASMGGFIAQRVAERYPERVRRLILCCTHVGGSAWRPPSPEALAPLLTPLPDPEANLRRNLKAFTAPGWAEAHPEVVDWYVAERLRDPPPPHGYQRQLEAALQWDNLARLGRIAAPTLILHGRLDPVVPPVNASMLAEGIPDARVELLEGAGHLLFMEAPAAFNGAVARFLGEADDEDAAPEGEGSGPDVALPHPLAEPLSLDVEALWDGAPAAPEERYRITLRPTSGALEIEVDAPYFGDPGPDAPPGSTPGLWGFEVVEVFVLGEEERYTEIELGPLGHHLVLALKGYRHVVREGLPLRFEAELRGARWWGRARIPLRDLPAPPWRFNAYAIHGQGPTRRYLAHTPVPGAGPDFHRLAYFTGG